MCSEETVFYLFRWSDLEQKKKSQKTTTCIENGLEVVKSKRKPEASFRSITIDSSIPTEPIRALNECIQRLEKLVPRRESYSSLLFLIERIINARFVTRFIGQSPNEGQQ